MDDPDHFSESSSSKRRRSITLEHEGEKRVKEVQGRAIQSRDGSERDEDYDLQTSTLFRRSSSSSPDPMSDDGSGSQSTYDRQSSQPTAVSHRAPSWSASESITATRTPAQTNAHLTAPPLSLSARMPSSPLAVSLSSSQPLVNPPAKTQAAFVGKLYAMLEDDEISKTGLIHWSADGATFTCPNPTEFSKIVLPRFFKHNNWQSFVRQLNMYSFNKVNDMYATSTDPQAWEFRHPLFRRGELHLLASIRRKTTRPTHSEALATSPGEDYDGPRAMPGWMPDAGSTSTSMSFRRSPPKDRYRPDVYGYNMQTGETVTAKMPDETRRGYWDSSGSKSLSQTARTGETRYHPDSACPPITSRRSNPSPSHPDPPASVSPEAMAQEIATLQDRVHRLTSALNTERVENSRNSRALASYLLTIVACMRGPTPPAADLRAMQEGLTQIATESRAKYETLIASDTLTTLASSGSGPSLREDRRRQMYDLPAPVPSLPRPFPSLPDPRPQPVHPTPKSSPLYSSVPDGGPSIPPTSNYHALPRPIAMRPPREPLPTPRSSVTVAVSQPDGVNVKDGDEEKPRGGALRNLLN